MEQPRRVDARSIHGLLSNLTPQRGTVVRTPMRKTYALVTIAAVAACSASGTSEDSPIVQGRSGAASGGAYARAGSPGIAGQLPSAGGAPSFGGSNATAGKGPDSNGMAGQGRGGAPFAVGGSPSAGHTSSGGTAAGGRPGSNGGGPPGAGGKGGGASGGAAAGGRASGGNTAAGGGGPASTCTDANKTVSNNGTGKHCGYTYEYWKDSGNGTLILKPDGFSVDWSGVNDLLGRKGIRPGSGNLVVNYQADYQPNGNSYLCVYGWTRNPLVEYYIVDSWGNWRPPGGQGLVGTVTSDGGTYDIYKIAKTGPSIDGNGAFTQYWSVRQAKKTSGVITIANHLTAWKDKGMPMGSFYEVSMTVEGYQSSGKADIKFTMQ